MTPISLGIFASANQGAAATSFESIATTAVSTTTATITFSSIPQTYTHLQLRGIARTNRTATLDSIELRINGNSPTQTKDIQGDGTSASAGNSRIANGAIPGASANTSVFGSFVCDILDYSDGNKNKTIRSLTGFDNNGSGYFAYTSSMNNSASTVTSLEIAVGTGNSFVQYTHFALYGIKVAV